MEYFSTASKWVSKKSSQSYVSFAVFLVILVWAIAGIPLHFREIWYLIILKNARKGPFRATLSTERVDESFAKTKFSRQPQLLDFRPGL